MPSSTKNRTGTELLWTIGKIPPLNLLFFCLEQVYRVVVGCRNFLFDRGFFKPVHLPGKVVSVGNLAWGGTGKSPIVVEIAKFALSKNLCPVILTRGYKSGLTPSEGVVLKGGRLIVKHLKGERKLFLDEPQMISHFVPDGFVVVGAKRSQAVQMFLAHGHLENPNILWILDDGFQHRRIFRDVDILLLDGKQPFGERRRLIPRGILREPVSSYKRADLVLFTRAAEEKQIPPSLLSQITQDFPWQQTSFFVPFKTGLVPLKPEERSKPEKIVLWSAIAQASRLEEDCRKLGLIIESSYFKRDHERFSLGEVRRLSKVDDVATTWKDYFRDPSVFLDCGKKIWLLELQVELKKEFFDAVESRLCC